MSEQLNSVQQASSPKYLSLPWFITLVAAFCVLVLVAGTVAEEAGRSLGWVIWFVASVIFVVAWIVTYKYANPKLPLIWGVLMGVTAPRPSDVWLRQIAGEGWGKAIDIAITIIWVAIGVTIFNAIAKRNKSSSAG